MALKVPMQPLKPLVLPDFPGDEQRTATSNEVVTSRLTKEAVETVE
jgi:hypothetical protein